MQPARGYPFFIKILIPLLLLALLSILPRQLAQPRAQPQVAPEVTPDANGTDIAAFYEAAAAHRRQQDYPAAIDDLKRLLTAYPGQAQAVYQLGLLLAAVDPLSAEPYLAQISDLEPSLQAPAQELLGSIRSANLMGEPAYTFLAAGKSLGSLGEWDLAVAALCKAVEARPDYAEAWAYLGESRQHVEELAEIPEELEKAYALAPDSISANLFLALSHRRREDYERAAAYLERAAELDPDNPLILVEQGATLAEWGDLPAAQAAYEAAVALDPDNPLYWRLLADFALTYSSQIRELALPAARRAVILEPQDPLSLDVLGETFYYLEDYLSAERTLQDALAVDPACASARLHLGMVYLVQGRWEAARVELRRAADLAPGSEIAETVERLMERYFPY